jgi:single-strand DNA-binding protein
MAGIAKITLVGNLGRDPETRYTPNGRMNVSFTMAVSRRFNDQSGQQQERTNWYRVTAWGNLAETLDRMAQNGYLTKGKQVYVDGRFEAREWQDQQGQTRTSLEVTANELQLLGTRDGGDGGYGASAGAAVGGRAAARPNQEGEPRSLEEIPWEEGEPPF